MVVPNGLFRVCGTYTSIKIGEVNMHMHTHAYLYICVCTCVFPLLPGVFTGHLL